MPPKGHLPFDLHVLGLPLAFILSQDQTLLCKVLSFSFLSFCLDSDLSSRIDKVVLIVLLTFQTLLGSFVQRTFAQQLPFVFNRHRSRCFASAKVHLFPFRTTLLWKKIHLFLTFSLYAENHSVRETFFSGFTCFCDEKRGFLPILRRFSDRKGRKISQNRDFSRKIGAVQRVFSWREIRKYGTP